MPNGMVVGFADDINTDWNHGVPVPHPEEKSMPRISIIVWGNVVQLGTDNIILPH